MKNRVRKTISLILLVLAAAAYIFFTNQAFFANGEAYSEPVPQGRIQMTNWQADGDLYISQEDPQILFKDIRGSIKSIELEIKTQDKLEPKIYYTEEKQEEFTEAKTITDGYTYTNGVLRMSIDKNVYTLRIDVCESVGTSIQLGQVSYYTDMFRLNAVIFICFLFAVALVLLPVYLPVQTFRNLWSHTKNFKHFQYLLSNLVRRDIITKYRRSILGIFWSVLNPFLMMLVITAVFQNLFRIQVENFPVYYLTGSLLFNFNSEATQGAMTSVVGSAPLLKKVYIPKYIFPLEKCLFAFVNMMFAFVATMIMVAILGMPFRWTMFLSFIPFIYVFVFSLGLGMILSTLNVYFRDTTHLYGVFVTAWFYMTPIIYPVDILPKIVMAVVKVNPLYYYADYFRQLVMYGTVPDLQTNAICIVFSLLFLGVGLLFFKRRQDSFILYI